jgi:hypothetical protein
MSTEFGTVERSGRGIPAASTFPDPPLSRNHKDQAHPLQPQAKPPEEGDDGNGLPHPPVAGLLPHPPVAGLHVAEHEGLDLGIIKDDGLVLDVGVIAFYHHGEGREILQLNILHSLHHAVET